jgi:hypothetical protein
MIYSPVSPVAPAALLSGLEAYWRRISQLEPVPDRQDVSSDGLDRALPHTFVLERVAAGVARFRVAGQALFDLAAAEPRGMPISALFEAGARSELAERLETVFAGPSILGCPVRLARGRGRTRGTGQMLCLPLRGPTGAVDRIMGALVLDAPLPRGGAPLGFAPGPIRCEAVDMQRADAARPPLRLVVDNSDRR